MPYYSTRNHSLNISLKEAVIRGLAPDKGLFMPHSIPQIPESELKDLLNQPFPELSARVAGILFGDTIPPGDLREIVYDSINFDTPLVKVRDGIYSLELFHGPTLAFKDVGARFMARMLRYFTRELEEDIHVLVATSGDTGSAVANGFLGIKGIKVHVLYPSGLVSPLQEKQFTTLGENITALEIDGSFDDCQKLVKEAFADAGLNSAMNLTSANSINLARFMPQSFYYFNAVRQLGTIENVVFSVPSGNFGNLTAGLLAGKMGLPVKTFLAATNVNDIVPEYLRTGKFNPRPSVATVANAMDVGNPSNFERILDLFGHDHSRIREQIKGLSYTDTEIKAGIARTLKETGYLTDPHGATAYMAAESWLEENPGDHLVFLETAHPAKFLETVEESTGMKVEIPEKLAAFKDREKQSLCMSSMYEEFRDYLRKSIN